MEGKVPVESCGQAGCYLGNGVEHIEHFLRVTRQVIHFKRVALHPVNELPWPTHHPVNTLLAAFLEGINEDWPGRV